MRTLFAAATILCVFCCHALAGNYTVTIDGKQYDFDLGKEKIVKLDDGRSLTITVNIKEFVAFNAEKFSFEHPSRLTPSRTDLGDGIHQTMMASPLGTLLMIQEYSSVDPSGLVDMMVTELTKEEVFYGYEITKSDVEKTLTDGTKLTGKLVVSKYKDTEYTRYVTVCRGKDSGLMVVTQTEKTNDPAEKQILDLFWKTLKVSLK